MMRRQRRQCLTAVLMILLAVAGMPATAGEVKKYEWTYDYDDIVLWHLHLSFLHHAIPSVEWFLSATSHMKGNRHAFREFGRQFFSSTFASFQYTYTLNGMEHTRTYYARSGEDPPRLGVRGPTPPLYSNYLQVQPTEVHATLLSSDESAITWTALKDGRPADARRNDAELKAVRSIERDLINGRVPSGGEVTAFVSQPMCPSCEMAVRMFALQYDIDVNVNALSGDGGWASQRFMRKRVAFFTSALGSVTRSGSGFRPPTPPPSGDVAGYCTAPLSY
ncbi:hypothetical protein C8J98_101430 [Luteibacter sp. OK325]|nr:hypothetical protein C8J98_101430 [Luteibacter sp. OK325]